MPRWEIHNVDINACDPFACVYTRHRSGRSVVQRTWTRIVRTSCLGTKSANTSHTGKRAATSTSERVRAIDASRTLNTPFLSPDRVRGCGTCGCGSQDFQCGCRTSGHSCGEQPLSSAVAFRCAAPSRRGVRTAPDCPRESSTTARRTRAKLSVFLSGSFRFVAQNTLVSSWSKYKGGLN